MIMDIKEFRELWLDDQVESVHKDVDNSWRHGCYVNEVFHKSDDNTYWAVHYQVDGTGDYNSLREMECGDPVQVKPVKKMIETIEYIVEE